MNTDSLAYIVYLLIGWNVITFLLMAIDKYKAIRGKWRIREDILIASAFAMGAIGSLAGVMICRHKTRTWKFRILLPIAFIFNISVVFLIWYYWM